MKLRSTVALLALGTMFAVPTAARADFTWEFGTLITGDSPDGDVPWATLFVSDSGVDEVTFELTFNDGGADVGEGEFLSELYLNFDGDVSGLSLVSSDEDVENVTFSQDGFTDAARIFDIWVDFETANVDDLRIERGETVSWTFGGDGISSEDFNTLSGANGDNEPVLALLHVQGIGEDNELSGKIAPPVPEPASMGVLALGALGVLARRRRK